jgi:hypothetical protein
MRSYLYQSEGVTLTRALLDSVTATDFGGNPLSVTISDTASETAYFNSLET